MQHAQDVQVIRVVDDLEYLYRSLVLIKHYNLHASLFSYSAQTARIHSWGQMWTYFLNFIVVFFNSYIFFIGVSHAQILSVISRSKYSAIPFLENMSGLTHQYMCFHTTASPKKLKSTFFFRYLDLWERIVPKIDGKKSVPIKHSNMRMCVCAYTFTLKHPPDKPKF